MLKEKLMEDLKEAMKSKNEIKKNTVQMVRAAILQIEKDKGIQVEDDRILEIIAKEVKTKRDAIKDFEKAERQDLIEQTNQEIEVLQQYLPKQLSREEIKVELEKIIAEIGATTMKDMGSIMKKKKKKMGASFAGLHSHQEVRQRRDPHSGYAVHAEEEKNQRADVPGGELLL